MSWRADFWDFLCERRHYLWLLLMMLLFFFILNVYALALGNQSSESRVVVQLNFVLILGAGAVAGGMYWKCLQQARKRY